ncbi:MAG: hypothetical protein AMXMBFR12_03420 [Candidatus Babeliales bacterium]
MKITFLGAAQEVTGSKYLVEQNNTKLLVECGLFQGPFKIAQRNWDEFPLDPASIKAVVLTHAHIDHSGYLPLLIKNGFRGKIYCSKATFELCRILLIDNGNIQEESAKRYNERKNDQANSATPLYTKADAEYALQFFEVMEYDTPFKIGVFTVMLIRCSHIIGSSFVVISNGQTTLTFSGDLSGSKQLIMQAPSHLKSTDYLVLESTYGDRLHEEGDPIEKLGQVINEAIQQNGIVLIPAFAVGRTQTILYCLYYLKQKKRISDVPVFLDSPMAISVTDLFCDYKEDYTLPVNLCKSILGAATTTPEVADSKGLANLNGPAIIIAGSGMMEGGRILYHLQSYISDPKNTLIIVGYQAPGTKGSELMGGAKEINLFGNMHEVHAKIKYVDFFSAHADYNEILEWLSHFESAPKKVFLTHGEFESAQSLKSKIEQRFGWKVIIPKYKDSFDLE